MADLIIKKDGILVAGDKQINDVIRWLFYTCEFEAGLTLRDILILVQKNLKDLEPILNCHVGEYVGAGLAATFAPVASPTLNYLELYYSFGLFHDYDAALKPGFHGISLDDQGNKTQYGITYIDFSEFIDLPIILNTEAIYWGHEKKNRQQTSILKNPPYYLGDVLHAIFWEFSWHGGPEETKKFITAIFKD